MMSPLAAAGRMPAGLMSSWSRSILTEPPRSTSPTWEEEAMNPGTASGSMRMGVPSLSEPPIPPISRWQIHSRQRWQGRLMHLSHGWPRTERISCIQPISAGPGRITDMQSILMLPKTRTSPAAPIPRSSPSPAPSTIQRWQESMMPISSRSAATGKT